MVRPDQYEVIYEINPWMSPARPADRSRAVRQWEGLRAVLTGACGAEVLLASPEPGLPDLVFTANAGLVYGRKVVLSNFRHPERRGETPHFREWFRSQGFETLELPEELRFEGEGDALFLGEQLFAGYYWRSDARSHWEVGERLGLRVLSLRLTDSRFYHLDTCFCPLDAETVAYYPGAFDEYALRVIAEHAPRRIELEEAEALRFGCNAVVLGRNVALNTGCPRFEAELRALGFTPHATPLDEFLKAGGSAKCLTLHLDRPEFARPSETVERGCLQGVGGGAGLA